MHKTIGPIITPPMLKVLHIAGIQPFWWIINERFQYFWLGIDHDGMDFVRRVCTCGVVAI